MDTARFLLVKVYLTRQLKSLYLGTTHSLKLPILCLNITTGVLHGGKAAIPSQFTVVYTVENHGDYVDSFGN